MTADALDLAAARLEELRAEQESCAQICGSRSKSSASLHHAPTSRSGCSAPSTSSHSQSASALRSKTPRSSGSERFALMECPRVTVGAQGEGKGNAFAKLVEEDAFTPFVKRWQHSPAMRRSVNRPLINKNLRVRDGPNLHKDGCLVLRLNGLVSKGWDDECVHSAEIVK
jgi:hypothetical protein